MEELVYKMEADWEGIQISRQADADMSSIDAAHRWILGQDVKA